MANIELVINIPKETYKALVINQYCGSKSDLESIIVNGTPLPEHGRLIDKDKMIEDLLTVNPQFHYLVDWCLMVTEAQTTIVERSKDK